MNIIDYHNMIANNVFEACRPDKDELETDGKTLNNALEFEECQWCS